MTNMMKRGRSVRKNHPHTINCTLIMPCVSFPIMHTLTVVGVSGRGADSEGGTGGKKTRIAGLYRPPTHDELRTLKETENLYQSNLMRLQVPYHQPTMHLLYTAKASVYAVESCSMQT